MKHNNFQQLRISRAKVGVEMAQQRYIASKLQLSRPIQSFTINTGNSWPQRTFQIVSEDRRARISQHCSKNNIKWGQRRKKIYCNTTQTKKKRFSLLSPNRPFQQTPSRLTTRAQRSGTVVRANGELANELRWLFISGCARPRRRDRR